jgi:hypothetical protein
MLQQHEASHIAGTGFEIVRREASHWWRTNNVAGAILHRLMLLFIAGPVVLVINRYYTLSFVVFAMMVPYGLLLQYLAERYVARTIREHPETIGHFEDEGVVVR